MDKIDIEIGIEAASGGAGAVIRGTADPRFAAVVAAFVENFRRRGEVGAACTVMIGGETLVDLWGGIADPATGAPWERDTVVVTWSCTKAVTALVVHRLVAAGLLDLDRPIAALWPAFAAEGKGGITPRMVLSHTAGLPALRAPVPEGGFTDWDLVTRLIAAEAPFWEPGTATGYHAFTYGFILGELVRRVTGETLGQRFAREIAGPLGLDFWIGLPEAIESRVAPVIGARRREMPDNPFTRAVFQEPGSIPNRMILNTGGWNAGGVNSRAGRAAEIPAAGGVGHARALAGLYAPLAAGGGALLDAPSLRQMVTPASGSTDDRSLRLGSRFGLGVMLAMDNRAAPDQATDSLIMGPRAFGHVGSGGSVGLADPDHDLAFGYVMNRMGPGLLLTDRGQALIDATYRVLAASPVR